LNVLIPWRASGVGYHGNIGLETADKTQRGYPFMIAPITTIRKAVSACAGRLSKLAVGCCWLLAMTISDAAAQPPAAAPGEADLETGVRVAQCLRDAQRKREAGQVTEALADLRAANTLIKKTLGDNHPDTLPVLDLAGLILLENGQCAEAQNPLRKAVALREALTAEGKDVSQVETAAALVLLARAQMGVGVFEPAADLLAKAVELFGTSVGPGHPSTEAALERLAEVHFGIGDSAAGQAALERLLKRRQQRAGKPAEVLATATLLARARAWQGNAATAIEPLATVVTAHERSHVDAPAVASALRQLAELQAECGDLDAAGVSLERARSADQKLSGEGHAAVLIDSLLLLKLDAMRGDTAAGQAACGPIVSAIDPLVARDDPQAAAVLRAAAEVHLASQDLGTAAELFRRALDLDTKLLGADHPDRAADEAGLGRCLLGSGDTKAARPLLDRALAVSKRVRGPFHAETLALLAEVGVCAARAGDLATSAGILKTLIDRGVARRSDAFEEDLCDLVEGVAGLEERTGNTDRAIETRSALIGLRQQQFGQQHERVADVMVRLAHARQAAGVHADAVALYEKAIEIMEQVRSATDPEVAAILVPLAVSYRAIGANEKAEESLARGLAIWEASVGPDHPVTIATLKPLALVQLALRKNDAALPLMTRLLAAYDADPATPPTDTIKLLKKLAQIHESRGEAEIARSYLERAVAAEGALGKSAGAAGDTAGE
jgi:tetratricopeptide (TPR) repeat protein